MINFHIEHLENGAIDRTLFLYGKEFEYNTQQVRDDNTGGVLGNIPCDDTPNTLFEQVVTAMPCFSERVYSLIAELDIATDEEEVAQLVEAIRNELHAMRHNYSNLRYMNYTPCFVCRIVEGQRRIVGELCNPCESFVIEYSGATLIEAMEEFRKAVDKFIAFGVA